MEDQIEELTTGVASLSINRGDLLQSETINQSAQVSSPASLSISPNKLSTPEPGSSSQNPEGPPNKKLRTLGVGPAVNNLNAMNGNAGNDAADDAAAIAPALMVRRTSMPSPASGVITGILCLDVTSDGDIVRYTCPCGTKLEIPMKQKKSLIYYCHCGRGLKFLPTVEGEFFYRMF